MTFGLAACSTPAADGGEAGGLIGVAMPTRSSERWIADGDALVAELEAAGYAVDLQFAEDDIPTQVSQVENMITKGAEALIIAAIDGTTLTEVLQTAADSDIPVFACDRLIRDSENVNHHATFDNSLVVQQHAWTVLTEIEQAATLRRDGEVAQSCMEDLLTANYSDGSKVTAVLSPYDGLSRGIISALVDTGYWTAEELGL